LAALLPLLSVLLPLLPLPVPPRVHRLLVLMGLWPLIGSGSAKTSWMLVVQV
jgi:hypothetical protein